MTQKERIAEIILQLKQIREERGLTIQDVHDLVISSGGYVSISSVKRVFSEESETASFRYQDTIQPIVRALLGVNEETPENNDITANEIDALKNVILLKDSIIKDLQSQNEALSEKVENLERESARHIAEMHQLREEAKRKIDHLLEEVTHLQRENDNLWAENRRKAKIIDMVIEKQNLVLAEKEK